MWERVIIHSDINHCYAQIEEMMFPELRKVPMVVGGNEKSRHGIVLAKNDLAKKYHIKTGESLHDAYQKCPDLLVISPHYDDYLYYTEEVKNIYREYTDQVESFGLDEAWIDLTSSQMLFGGDPIVIAREIQERIYREIGITVSMGVSFNKVFAKLGSDLNKEKGLTVISKKNFRDVVFPLQVRDLFYVGKATTAKLNEKGIYTIGDIAHQRKAKGVFRTLVESVSSRLKDQNLKGSIISIHMRDSHLQSFTRQKKIDLATNISSEIMTTVEILLNENCLSYSGHLDKPYRSVSVCVSQLRHDYDEVQLNFFVDENERQKEKRIDIVFDEIRRKFGFGKIKKCCMELNKELTNFNPKEEHIIHPEGWFK